MRGELRMENIQNAKAKLTMYHILCAMKIEINGVTNPVHLPYTERLKPSSLAWRLFD